VVLFMSQAPILVLLVPAIVLIALFEMVGLKARRNILALSAVAQICLIAALLASASNTVIASLLYGLGVTLAVLLALYTLATSRRGKQWPWFSGVLSACCVTLIAAIAVRATLGSQNADSAAVVIFALTLVPGLTTLVYGLFAPDIPKPRGNM
jgi:hypothetical protein